MSPCQQGCPLLGKPTWLPLALVLPELSQLCCDKQQRPAAGRGWDLQWCFYFRCSHSFLLENTPALPLQQGKKKKAAGKDLEHVNNCTCLSGHISIFPRRSHGDDPILLLFQSSLTCYTGRKSLLKPNLRKSSRSSFGKGDVGT